MVSRANLVELVHLYGLKCQVHKLLDMYNFPECAGFRYVEKDATKCDSDFEHIHHIDRDRKNNDIDNLIPLCSICHDWIHHGWPIKEKTWYHFRTGMMSTSRNPRYW